MSDHKLIQDFQEIISTLLDYDKIRLINTIGDPVNEYYIEYKVRGYSRANGCSPRITDRHRIKIALPLGYPYFHPEVQPITPIFHPDIDQNTISIAHYWQEGKSLIDLILHIGEMISGKHYTTKNPLDKKAAAYFKKHKNNLPLDNIKNNSHKPKKTRKPESFRPTYLLSFFKITTVIVILFTLAGTALYFFDKSKTDKAQQLFDKARKQAENYAYKEAQTAAKHALEQLQKTILINTSDKMEREINMFLDSKTMRQGLLGKILYHGKYENIHTVHKLEILDQLTRKAEKQVTGGNLESIISSYTEALTYARDNNLAPAIMAPIQKELARYSYQQLKRESELAHASKDWKWAVTQHQNVVDFLTQNIPFVEDADKKLSQATHTLLLDEIALYTQKAEKAENEDAFPQALHLHNMVISHIQASPHRERPLIRAALQHSLQKETYLKEKLIIRKQQKWLLAHYKEIFESLESFKIMGILRNPQADFIKYNGEKRVYGLSCFDKSGGSVVRLKLCYQFDPVNRTWEIYREECH